MEESSVELCFVCGGEVRAVDIEDRLKARRQMNVRVDVGLGKDGRRKVRHSYCAPGTLTWARNMDPTNPRERGWLERFGYDPDSVGEKEDEDMAGKKKGVKKAAKPKAAKVAKEKARDPRLPSAGTVIRKEYGGKTHEVRINESDFTYDGERHKSLSAVSGIITGGKFAHGISGFVFFKAQLAEKVAEQSGKGAAA